MARTASEPPGGVRSAAAQEATPADRLIRTAQFFFPGEQSGDRHRLDRWDVRASEEFYRERWRHDREVRSTHWVNCTGSCSWRVYVKDGIITWASGRSAGSCTRGAIRCTTCDGPPSILYRHRVPSRPTEPGTSGRRWRRIGVRY
jgi:anaerobic selenocysteine-containing dehydrogenase